MYLKKLDSNKFAFLQTQKEILFLEKDILPIVLNNTSIIHNEVYKYFIRAFDTALSQKCNSMLMYLPIDENYIDRPKIGIANLRANMDFGSPGAMELFTELINMDANEAKPQPLNLNLDALL